MVSRIEPGLPADAQAQPHNDATWTLPNVQKDFTDWRAGRHRYAVWAIDLDHDWLREASENMRQHCADLLLPDYARQPHVTLRICGFPGPNRRLGDDYTQADLAAQVSALESAQIEPFPISIGALDTFTTAPYFSVIDIELTIRSTFSSNVSSCEGVLPPAEMPLLRQPALSSEAAARQPAAASTLNFFMFLPPLSPEYGY